MDEINYASAKTIAQAIRDKEVSAVEVVEAHLQRIDEVNPKLNAVVHLAADRALSEAREADAATARGESKGPLHGVPMTVKDSHDAEGLVSTGGTKGRENFVPDRDATTVARMRAAGAIVLGKTNTPELTLAFETDNLIYGRTNNPYGLDRTPGGSSGGAGAIIASGGSPLDLGTDTGGSVRVPAGFCGIAGLKPTSGRVPRTGHIISHSGVLVLPNRMAPAARSRAATTESSDGTKDSRPLVPPVDMMPSVSNESLSVIGTPCSGPTESPRANASSAALASESARSAHSCTTALSAPFTCPILSRCACTTSSAEISLCRIA